MKAIIIFVPFIILQKAILMFEFSVDECCVKLCLGEIEIKAFKGWRDRFLKLQLTLTFESVN